MTKQHKVEILLYVLHIVMYCGNVQHMVALELTLRWSCRQALEVASYSRFEAKSSFEKSSFILGNKLWEEHFESLLDLVAERISARLLIRDVFSRCAFAHVCM